MHTSRQKKDLNLTLYLKELEKKKKMLRVRRRKEIKIMAEIKQKPKKDL